MTSGSSSPRRGLRPPPELLPDLLDHASPQHHGLVGEAAGPLGRWLAEREPRWAFVRGAVDDVDAVWASGGRQARRALLERLRRTDPAAARELLASTFADETWEDRAAFVDALEIGLSDADEPFLEAALDDSRAAVRDAAAARSPRCPRSRLAARMADAHEAAAGSRGRHARRHAARRAGRGGAARRHRHGRPALRAPHRAARGDAARHLAARLVSAAGRRRPRAGRPRRLGRGGATPAQRRVGARAVARSTTNCSRCSRAPKPRRIAAGRRGPVAAAPRAARDVGAASSHAPVLDAIPGP